MRFNALKTYIYGHKRPFLTRFNGFSVLAAHLNAWCLAANIFVALQGVESIDMQTVKTELLTFLSTLPHLDIPAERKALLAFTGFAMVGLHLDFSGSQADFAGALVTAVCGRGQAFSLQFLAALKNAPQVGSAHQDQLDDLIVRFAALSAAAWETAFPTAAQAPTAPSSQPDPAMLTLSIVSDLLLPYFTLGVEQLRGQHGAAVVALAERVVEVLEGDGNIRPLLTMFKAAPTATEAGFLAALKTILTADTELALTLANMLSPEDGMETADLAARVQISQAIRVVSGDVVGAVVGQEVVSQLSVTQKVDTVSAGGTLVGAVIGAPGKTQIGGQTVAGDYVAGDKIEGDQIKTGDITDSSGIAVGRDASAITE